MEWNVDDIYFCWIFNLLNLFIFLKVLLNKVVEYKYEGLLIKFDYYYSFEYKEKGIEMNEFCIFGKIYIFFYNKLYWFFIWKLNLNKNFWFYIYMYDINNII